MDGQFFSSNGATLVVDEMVSEIIRFIDADRSKKYTLIIGTDSGLVERREGKQNGMADFVTAIVIRRVGNGGRYFWRRMKYQKTPSLRYRVYQEVLYSIEAAQELVSYFKDTNADVDFEIHVDVGENGETKSMIQELVGMIRAYNFEAKTKPESFAASTVADKHV